MISVKSSKLHYVGIFLISLLPFLQIGNYVGQRYFPALVACAILSSIFLLNKLSNPVIKMDFKLLWAVIVYVPLLLFPFITSQSFYEFVFNFVKILIPLLLFIFFYMIFGSLSSLQRRCFLNLYIRISIILGILETYLRISSADSLVETFQRNFYGLKVDSPFFADSNAAGIYYLVSLVLLFGMDAFRKRIVNLNSLMISVLIILTLSRAAILAMVVMYILKWFFARGSATKIITFVVGSMLVLASIPLLYNMVADDGSGYTKIMAYTVFFTKITNGSVDLIDILLGVGINEGSLLYGYDVGKFSHALVPMVVGQVGILGAFCYFSFFFVLLFYAFKPVLFLFLAMFISGLSYLHPFYEYIFVAAGILFAFNNAASNKESPIES